MKLEGMKAIELAEAEGLALNSYATDLEPDGRDDLTPDEARKIAAEDPRLVWVEIPQLPALTTDLETCDYIHSAGWQMVSRKTVRTDAPCDYVDRRQLSTSVVPADVCAGR